MDNILVKPYLRRDEIIKLQDAECGVTELSIKHARKLMGAFGVPVSIQGVETNGWKAVKAVFDTGCLDKNGERELVEFKFTGFNWGYGGEGPRGFEWLLHQCGFRALAPSVDPTNPAAKWGTMLNGEPVRLTVWRGLSANLWGL